MAPVPILLQSSADLAPRVERVVASALDRLRPLLPAAEIDHIGATAIPGALTKGDIDLVVRVPAAEFAAAIAVLSAHFTVKQRENWTPDFASFGDDTAYELPLGVQLIVQTAAPDFMTFLRDHLRAHPAALAAYNRLKTTHAPQGAEAYWQAKHDFFTAILAARS